MRPLTRHRDYRGAKFSPDPTLKVPGEFQVSGPGGDLGNEVYVFCLIAETDISCRQTASSSSSTDTLPPVPCRSGCLLLPQGNPARLHWRGKVYAGACEIRLQGSLQCHIQGQTGWKLT